MREEKGKRVEEGEGKGGREQKGERRGRGGGMGREERGQ